MDNITVKALYMHRRHLFLPVHRIFLLIPLILLAWVSVEAQYVGKISGKVKDAETGEPVVGCNLLVVGTKLGASTAPDGTFYILNVPSGKYDLQASIVGYRTVVQRDLIVDADRTTAADFTLTAAALEQKEIVVEAVRPDVEKEKTSTSAIIRSDEVQSIAGIRDVGDVLSLAADVTDGHFRGGRSGEEYYTLQGMGILNPLDNSHAFLPIMSAVEEVEVITSGFGAQYGNAQSGVVNISMKEGNSQKWGTRVESRMRAPGKKHFGPSVFDPSANPYLRELLNGNVWLEGDPESNNTPYYWAMGSGLNSRYAGDTAVQVAVARALWQLQTKRDLYRSYGNDPDYSVEGATGGPINDNMRMFLAMRTNNEWPVFPTEQPDVQRQVMGNVAADLGKGAVLRLSGGFTQENDNVFPSANGLGYLDWLWDRILSIDYQKLTNLELGARFTYASSASTYYELKLSTLSTKTRLGSTPAPGVIPDSDIVNSQHSTLAWNNILGLGLTGPDGFSYLNGDDGFRDELTRTISFEGSVTSQVTPAHLLNAGLQVNTYHIDVANYLNTRRSEGGPMELYNANPIEGALYLQDKMEFEGMIANVGLRFDVWSSNVNYYTNLFTPYTVVDSLGRPSNNPAQAPQAKTPVLGRLQPRAGVSFPVSLATVFHLNYGSFMQRPSFQYVVAERSQQGLLKPLQLGNPRLQPEMTNSYDVGVTQGVGEGFTLDVSGYYKDVKNLVESATFTSDRAGFSYTTYFNRDYADIRGFRVALTKRRGIITGSLNYQYSVATGKSATTSNAPPTFEMDTTGAVATKLDNVPIRDILLDFDRTHNFIVNLTCTTPDQWGPEVAGIHPFENFILSSISFFRSGRPYTSPSNPKVINGARTPGEYNTNVKLTRVFSNFFGLEATLYLEVFNLFDNKILNYDYIFAAPSANKTNALAAAYEQYPIDDPNHGILYWPLNAQPQLNWGVDQSFLIYDNSPRSFNLGFTLDF